MHTQSQNGLSILKIIVILAMLAVAAGLISTFTGNEPTDITRDTAQITTTDTPIETYAANKAADLASPVTEAVQAKNDAMEAELAANVAIAPEAPAVTAPAPEVVDESTPSPAPASVAAGTFDSYSADKLALAADGTVVLFFHADWCPSCRGLENDINAKLSQIPANTHILKLDYDTETTLKKKYGVVRQHTLVVVDANGNEIKKLTGLTNTLAQVTNQL